MQVFFLTKIKELKQNQAHHPCIRINISNNTIVSNSLKNSLLLTLSIATEKNFKTRTILIPNTKMLGINNHFKLAYDK